MDSGFLAEPVIGPATSGRTRWLGPGMTRHYCAGAAGFGLACFFGAGAAVAAALA
jgi:hypothetical protein